MSTPCVARLVDDTGAPVVGPIVTACGLVCMVMGLAAVADKSMFVQFLVEGNNPSTVATKSNLDNWINSLKVPFTMARDPDGTAAFTLRTTYGVKETTYIIERATRKIVYKNTNTATAFEKLKTMP